MARDNSGLPHNAVLLKNESIGIATENTPRKLYERPNQRGYRVSLNPDWLEQIGIAESKQTLHSVSMGVKPVIVQNPAIIIQNPHDIFNNNE